MNRDIVDGRMERELRRRHLAVRLISHQARTRTIEELTGLTRHQLATLRRQAGVPTDSRFRGPAPTSFEVFFTSTRTRNQSAVLAFIYCALVPSKSGRANGSLDAAIERGERLCDVYETWQQLFPSPQLEFEHLTLLGEGVTRGEQISFACCGGCQAIILIDLLEAQRKLCGHCSRARREHSRPPEDEEMDLLLYPLQLLGGRLLRERNGRYTLEEDEPAPT